MATTVNYLWPDLRFTLRVLTRNLPIRTDRPTVEKQADLITMQFLHAMLI